jgi:hypothetical protein
MAKKIEETAEQQRRLFHTLSTRVDLLQSEQDGAHVSGHQQGSHQHQQQEQQEDEEADDAFTRQAQPGPTQAE